MPKFGLPCQYGRRVIAVLLSVLLDDGVQGLQVVRQNGGTVIVLKPADASFPQMPENAIKHGHPNYVLSAREIVPKNREIIADFQSDKEMAHNSEVNEPNESASDIYLPGLWWTAM